MSLLERAVFAVAVQRRSRVSCGVNLITAAVAVAVAVAAADNAVVTQPDSCASDHAVAYAERKRKRPTPLANNQKGHQRPPKAIRTFDYGQTNFHRYRTRTHRTITVFYFKLFEVIRCSAAFALLLSKSHTNLNGVPIEFRVRKPHHASALKLTPAVSGATSNCRSEVLVVFNPSLCGLIKTGIIFQPADSGGA